MKAITFNLLAWVMLPIMDGFAKYLSALKYLAKPSIIGSITHAKRLNVIAFI